jgi:hypothetical protein
MKKENEKSLDAARFVARLRAELQENNNFSFHLSLIIR